MLPKLFERHPKALSQAHKIKENAVQCFERHPTALCQAHKAKSLPRRSQGAPSFAPTHFLRYFVVPFCAHTVFYGYKPKNAKNPRGHKKAQKSSVKNGWAQNSVRLGPGRLETLKNFVPLCPHGLFYIFVVPFCAFLCPRGFLGFLGP